MSSRLPVLLSSGPLFLPSSCPPVFPSSRPSSRPRDLRFSNPPVLPSFSSLSPLSELGGEQVPCVSRSEIHTAVGQVTKQLVSLRDFVEKHWFEDPPPGGTAMYMQQWQFPLSQKARSVICKNRGKVKGFILHPTCPPLPQPPPCTLLYPWQCMV